MNFRPCLSPLFAVAFLSILTPSFGQAQSAVLSEIYGRGVHAYHSGQYQKADEWLDMAINNGFQDPRAFYFRGLSATAMGDLDQADSDFRQGADLEAKGAFGDTVGRSLARVQGPVRLQIEQVRDRSRLQALATGRTRSDARYGELGVDPRGAGGIDPRPPVGRQPAPGSQPLRRAAVTPPPAPATANPFADDLDEDPTVESMDAFKDVQKNASVEPDKAGDAAAPPAGANPFGNDSAPTNDPFGGAAPAEDPFGGGAGTDPFGGDSPF